ncbi:unnamed protein product [Phyllotreta striolata]|uniref:C2H2-type domain-containing protein n=1 Tax=Phyllotreta striolata TaxID=444603 RepID=A0A9N9THU7_PHYSR|nr:unnamed protein product [Phyllotreta striolata]
MVNSATIDASASSVGKEDRNATKICAHQNQNAPAEIPTRCRSSPRQKNDPSDAVKSEESKNSEDDNTLCCSVPLDKVQGVLITINHPKCDEPKSTRKLLCLYCERSFAGSNLRSKHVERVHSVKKNRRLSSRKQQLNVTPCIYCEKITSGENTLKELFHHLVTEHSDRYFGCLCCEERFLTNALLSDHIAVLHPTVELSKTIVEAAQLEDFGVKVTRSRMKPPKENPPATSRKAKLKDLRNKKLTVKSSRIALNRRESKRLQALAKLSDTQKKKKRQKPAERKQNNANKSETMKLNKPASICVNPYPEFDSFFRVKKITDHSIDNLKISSLTFDDVFDKAFFNRIKCNIEENLLHHIDGKLFENEESESRISNFEKISTAQPEIQNAASDNFGCELSLNAVAPIAALSLNSQFGEDFESQIEYGSKPSKKKTQTKKDEVHYKYFTRRKFQASILEHKENRDLSKLDIWTQLVIKKRQQKIIDDKKTAKEILEYTACDEYKNKMKKEELNRILDRRGPFEDLREEANKKAALDKLNSVSEDSISQESFSEVREVLNGILNRVFAVTEQPAEAFKQATSAQTSSKSDLREIPSFLNLRRASSLHFDDEIDRSDAITLICSSQDTENFEHPSNTTRGKNELAELSGEWARCRMYICAACGAKLPNMKYLLDHKTIYHQNVWVQHYEFVGNQSELYRHLSIPTLGKVGFIEDTTTCKLWRRSDARTCSKCSKNCNTLGELHRHILECGGDWTWMLVRKKCKYRYGAKSRKKRRGTVVKVHTKRKTDDSTEKKKCTYNGPRQRPSDAETIQRMLANLPAKRSTRKLISLYDGVRRRQTTKLDNVKQKKVKCGKVIYDKCSNIKETTEKTINAAMPRAKSKMNNKSSNARSMRSLNRVLSSRILDTSANLNVKRKLKALNDRRKTRNSLMMEKEGENDAGIKTKEANDLNSNSSAPKRTSPRSTKLVRTLKHFTGNSNIKSYFPVKKRKLKAAENTDIQTRSRKKSIEVGFESKNEKITNKKNSKKEKPTQVEDDPKKVSSEEDQDLSNRKRKLKQSFRNVINRVKRLKIDAAPKPEPVQTQLTEKPQTATKNPFLDERKEKEVSVKIVIPSNMEAKENIADISETAHTVIPFNGSNEDSPVPENIFKLDPSNEKNLQAKGVESHQDKTVIEENDKLESTSLETSAKPTNSTNAANGKGKIRKPARGLNDCIAMLTSKLQQKTSVVEEVVAKPSSSSPKIVTNPTPQVAECILKIPSFKTQSESLDVALDLSTKSRTKQHQEFNEALPNKKAFTRPVVDFRSVESIIDNKQKFDSICSIDRTIQNVIDSHSMQQKAPHRTTVDDIIDYVININGSLIDNNNLNRFEEMEKLPLPKLTEDTSKAPAIERLFEATKKFILMSKPKKKIETDEIQVPTSQCYDVEEEFKPRNVENKTVLPLPDLVKSAEINQNKHEKSVLNLRNFRKQNSKLKTTPFQNQFDFISIEEDTNKVNESKTNEVCSVNTVETGEIKEENTLSSAHISNEEGETASNKTNKKKKKKMRKFRFTKAKSKKLTKTLTENQEIPENCGTLILEKDTPTEDPVEDKLTVQEPAETSCEVSKLKPASTLIKPAVLSIISILNQEGTKQNQDQTIESNENTEIKEPEEFKIDDKLSKLKIKKKVTKSKKKKFEFIPLTNKISPISEINTCIEETDNKDIDDKISTKLTDHIKVKKSIKNTNKRKSNETTIDQQSPNLQDDSNFAKHPMEASNINEENDCKNSEATTKIDEASTDISTLDTSSKESSIEMPNKQLNTLETSKILTRRAKSEAERPKSALPAAKSKNKTQTFKQLSKSTSLEQLPVSSLNESATREVEESTSSPAGDDDLLSQENKIREAIRKSNNSVTSQQEDSSTGYSEENSNENTNKPRTRSSNAAIREITERPCSEPEDINSTKNVQEDRENSVTLVASEGILGKLDNTESLEKIGSEELSKQANDPSDIEVCEIMEFAESSFRGLSNPEAQISRTTNSIEYNDNSISEITDTSKEDFKQNKKSKSKNSISALNSEASNSSSGRLVGTTTSEPDCLPAKSRRNSKKSNIVQDNLVSSTDSETARNQNNSLNLLDENSSILDADPDLIQKFEKGLAQEAQTSNGLIEYLASSETYIPINPSPQEELTQKSNKRCKKPKSKKSVKSNISCKNREVIENEFDNSETVSLESQIKNCLESSYLSEDSSVNITEISNDSPEKIRTNNKKPKNKHTTKRKNNNSEIQEDLFPNNQTDTGLMNNENLSNQDNELKDQTTVPEITLISKENPDLEDSYQEKSEDSSTEDITFKILEEKIRNAIRKSLLTMESNSNGNNLIENKLSDALEPTVDVISQYADITEESKPEKPDSISFTSDKSKENSKVLKENLPKNNADKRRVKLKARKGKKRLIRARKSAHIQPEDPIQDISSSVLALDDIESVRNETNSAKEPPIKIVINKNKARRKSKSIKKVGLKGQNNLFEDFALVIKKKSRTPILTFSPPNAFFKDDDYAEDKLDDSIEEMDMELEEIPIKSTIIETPKVDLPLTETPKDTTNPIEERCTKTKKKGKSKKPREKSEEQIQFQDVTSNFNSEFTANFALNEDDFSSDDFDVDNSFEDSIIFEDDAPKQPSADAETLFNRLIENTDTVKPLVLKKADIFTGKEDAQSSESEDLVTDDKQSNRVGKLPKKCKNSKKIKAAFTEEERDDSRLKKSADELRKEDIDKLYDFSETEDFELEKPIELPKRLPRKFDNFEKPAETASAQEKLDESIEQKSITPVEIEEKKGVRSAKMKALESIHDEALSELADIDLIEQCNKKSIKKTKKIEKNADKEFAQNTLDSITENKPNKMENIMQITDTFTFPKAVFDSEGPLLQDLVAELDGLEELENSIERELSADKTSDKKDEEQAPTNDLKDPSTEDNQELRRSRRGSRKVASYNENDLIDPLIDAMETKRTAKKKDDKLTVDAKKKKLNSEQLFDMLKASSNDNAPTPKQDLNHFDNFKSITDENFDSMFKNILEKGAFLVQKKDSLDKFEFTESSEPAEPLNDSNFCDICNKRFVKLDNLIKHRRTLTHIQKLSEIEAKEAEKSKILCAREEETSRESVIELAPPVQSNHSFKLADIISDVIGKEEPNQFPDILVQNETKRYKSLGERKSFDSENVQLAEPTETILEKQISLLENIIENQATNNYIDDISSDTPTEPGSPSPLPPQPKTIASFAKPTQYEEISEDSANLRTYDDPKLRKTLNRDEELFLECCSLLKSGSEVSNSYSSRKVADAPRSNWTEKEDYLEKIHSNDYSDNSRIPTPLGNSYDDDASNSNTISSNWAVDISTDDENNYDVDNATPTPSGFSFDSLEKTEEQEDSDVGFKGILYPKRTESSSDDIHDSSSNNRKIITKGARKVFEGLKVSIPTEELNMDEVLNNSPKLQKSDKFDEEDKVMCSPTSKRKSKPIKKAQIGSNLLFKVNKKKLPSPCLQPHERDDKGYDVYDFEETQDNTDVYTKPNYRAFRTNKTEENGNESESEPAETEPILSSATKKSKAQEIITKNKCMIMGRIFKNAAKSKVEDIDEEIRNIPAIDNEELVENYVAECNKVITDECKSEPDEKTKQQVKLPKKQEKKKLNKHKGKKRVRTTSDSTDDEFKLNKTNKRKTNRKNGKEEDNCINLEQELKECIGVASRKSQRKCTSGKQNVLVEYWSSDDSQFEAMLEKQIIKEIESQPPAEIKKPIIEKKKPNKKKTVDNQTAEANNSNRRKRAAVNPLYHWSSSSEDEASDLIEVKPLREGLEEDEDRPVQHGWIVGDSPKKLVTMLAQAKGKKADVESVKEQSKKRTNTVS